MSRVLVISSQTAASRVGASAGGFVLQRLGHEAVVLPTVLLGRHPGWGAPGGGAVESATLESLWSGIAAQALRFDAVLTGYFARPDQVELAACIIDGLAPTMVMVDPVIGDNGALYVSEAVATAIRDTLVPRAHIITPNAWEHGWLTRESPIPDGVAQLITSHTDGERIGALYRDGDTGFRVAHERFGSVPHGGGDTLAALWLAHALDGMGPRNNLARSVGSVYALLRASVNADAGEIPLVRKQDLLLDAKPLEVIHD